LQLKK